MLHMLYILKAQKKKKIWNLYFHTNLSDVGFSVHGIFQARRLEWVAIFYSMGSAWPRDQPQISCISCTGRQILYHRATWEALEDQYLSLDNK